MNEEHIIACTQTLTVWNYYQSKAEADQALPGVKEQYLKDSYVYNDNHVKYGHREEGYWLKEASKARSHAKNMRVMTWADYLKAEANAILSKPLEEVTAERYDEMLNILPPLRWKQNNGIESFFMSEFDRGNYTRQFATLSGRYFTKIVDYRKPETWVSFDMIKALKEGVTT